VILIDTETSGVSRVDGIYELAATDGQRLFHAFVQPPQPNPSTWQSRARQIFLDARHNPAEIAHWLRREQAADAFRAWVAALGSGRVYLFGANTAFDARMLATLLDVPELPSTWIFSDAMKLVGAGALQNVRVGSSRNNTHI
jgi:hypothetical protein